MRLDASSECFKPFSESFFSMNSSMLFPEDGGFGGTSDQCVFAPNRQGSKRRDGSIVTRMGLRLAALDYDTEPKRRSREIK
jgi:hypothetical protein